MNTIGEQRKLKVKKPRIAGLFYELQSFSELAQVFVDGLVQMPDSAFLVAGENDLAGR